MRQFKRVNQQNVVLFTRRLATLLQSGLPLARALQVLAEQEDDYCLKSALYNVFYQIRSGVSLSFALSKYPDVFSSLFLSMVKVGEATGELGDMLDKLADFLERDFRVKKQAISSMTYPAFVLFFCLAVVGFIFMYILPTIMKIFTGMNKELPLPTMVVMYIIEMTKNPYVQLAVVSGAVYYAIYFRNSLRTPEGSFRFDKFKIKVPLLGNLNRKMLTANFCRAMSILLLAGIPMIKSMAIMLEFMSNMYFKQVVIQPIYEEVKNGKAIGQSMAEGGFFPDMVSNMITVGEDTGELPAMLSKISSYYDEELLHAMESFLTLIEPLMVCFLGVIVCFVLVAVFLPIYSLAGDLGQ